MERGEKKQEFRHSFSFHFVPSFIIRHNAEISFNSPKLEVCFSVVYRNFFRLSELSLQQSSYCLSPPSSPVSASLVPTHTALLVRKVLLPSLSSSMLLFLPPSPLPSISL